MGHKAIHTKAMNRDQSHRTRYKVDSFDLPDQFSTALVVEERQTT